MCVCTHTCMHVYMRSYLSVPIYLPGCRSFRLFALPLYLCCTSIHASIRKSTHVHMYLHYIMYMYMIIYIYNIIYICIYIYIHTHIYILIIHTREGLVPEPAVWAKQGLRTSYYASRPKLKPKLNLKPLKPQIPESLKAHIPESVKAPNP